MTTIKRYTSLAIGVGVFGAFALACLWVFFVLDPFNLGVTQSSKFSWPRFQTIMVGDRIESVVAKLGEPVRPSEPLVSMATNLRDICAVDRCRKYLFASGYGASFKEAVVITTSKGVVVEAYARQE